jgi:alpha-L-fucosidase 2
LIFWENWPQGQAIIKASMADLEKNGTSQWCGYSFSWLASLAARAKDGKKAEKALEIFSTAFCLRNSFHCNGDQSGKGYSNYRYRPFTLEGNFAAAAGLQEMLLQSYNDTIRLFPAVPANWKDISFKTFRAEGAFIVSAERRDGQTQTVTIISEKGSTCHIENPFGKNDYELQGVGRTAFSESENLFTIPTSAGQKITLIRKH